MRLPLLLGALLLAGCGSGGTTPGAPPASGGTRLLEAGGGGSDVTAPFDLKGRGLRVDYRLSTMPPNRQIAFTLESAGEGGSFETAGGATEPVAPGLSGSTTIPALAGRYRLRVDTQATWSGVLYDTP